jgi:CHAD domain-containing protein
LRHAIRRSRRRLGTAVDALGGALGDGSDRDAGLHEVRKKAKQARYAADLAGPAFGNRLRRWRDAAKAIQSTLGEHHDLVEARAVLRGVATTVPAPDAFVVGILHGRAHARAAALETEFARQWRDLPDPP